MGIEDRADRTEHTLEPELAQILAELSRREPLFHRPEFGTSRADFERMTVEDFWEIGASGRRYSRDFVLDELEKRFSASHDDVWQTRDFHCASIANEVYLLTYTLIQNGTRVTRRSTIWRRIDHEWKAVFHQGTLVPEPN